MDASPREPPEPEGNFADALVALIPALSVYARRLAENDEEARDLLQEALLTAWAKRSQLRSEESLLPWARRILLNRFLAGARRRPELSIAPLDDDGAEPLDFPDDAPSPEEELVVADAIRVVQVTCFTAIIRHLTLPQRAVFCLVETFGFDIAEASSFLDLSVEAGKALLHRARRHVYAYFASTCGLVAADNPCACEMWRDFIGDRVKLREEVRSRGLAADFSGEAPRAPDPRKVSGVYALFRRLPAVPPEAAWYEAVAEALRARVDRN